jgi:5-methylcytosine-specific restriction endonuclease McrA
MTQRSCATCGLSIRQGNKYGHCSRTNACAAARMRIAKAAKRAAREVRTCASDGCTKAIRSDNNSGYCGPCYKPIASAARYAATRYGGDMPEAGTCVADGCTNVLRLHNKYGYCHSHVNERDSAVRAARGLKPVGRKPLPEVERKTRRKASQKRYYRKNPHKGSEAEQVRRARKAALFVERVYRARVWAKDGGICHLCLTAANPNDWHLDHIISLTSGGTHEHDNCAVSHPACNWSKTSKSWSASPARWAVAMEAFERFHGHPYQGPHGETV